MSTPTEKIRGHFCKDFIARLEKLVEIENPGALSTLRRGLGKEIPFETYRFLPFKRTGWQEDAALLVGPLFAYWYQGREKINRVEEKTNIGTSMLDLVRILFNDDTDPDRNKAWERALKRVERRFSALLNCHVDDLKPHLRYVVSLLKSKEIPINWQLLCEHVQWWNHEDRWVQREWARSFWASGQGRSENRRQSHIDETLEVTNSDNARK